MRKFLIPFIALLTCCASQSEQNGNFYFPIKTLLTEQTYCFVNQNDTTERSYWKMKTSISNSDTILKTSIYDGKNRITEIMTERVLNGNSNIASYTLYDYDSQGNQIPSNCSIIKSSVFKALQKNDEQIQWKVGFNDFRTQKPCELSKSRVLKSTIGDKKTFSDQMDFAVTGTKQGYQYSMLSVYEKGKGLVSYKLTLPDGKVKCFVLIAKFFGQ
jgi:hypothetical protein